MSTSVSAVSPRSIGMATHDCMPHAPPNETQCERAEETVTAVTVAVCHAQAGVCSPAGGTNPQALAQRLKRVMVLAWSACATGTKLPGKKQSGSHQDWDRVRSPRRSRLERREEGEKVQLHSGTKHENWI